jgi:hypothetical protein
MRVQTDVHHDPIGYGLGLMVTKRAPQADGWMDGQTDATRNILLTQLSAELKTFSKLTHLLKLSIESTIKSVWQIFK